MTSLYYVVKNLGILPNNSSLDYTFSLLILVSIDSLIIGNLFVSVTFLKYLVSQNKSLHQTRVARGPKFETQARPAARIFITFRPVARIFITFHPAARIFITFRPVAHIFITFHPAARIFITFHPAARIFITFQPAARNFSVPQPAARKKLAQIFSSLLKRNWGLYICVNA